MTYPPRPDPIWLIVPVLALLLAMVCPGLGPLPSHFGAEVPGHLIGPVGGAGPRGPVLGGDRPRPLIARAISTQSRADTPPPPSASPTPHTPAPPTSTPRTAPSPAMPTPAPIPAPSSAPAAVSPLPPAPSLSPPPSPSPSLSPAPSSPPSPAPTVPPSPPAGAAGITGWRWPLAGPVAVARGFRAPPHPYGPGHRGADLRSTPGSRVEAANAGVVSFAGWIGDRWVVTVLHGELRTTYEPVRPLVHVGDPVAAGTAIGVLEPGHRNCPASACLHWGLLRGADYLDPLRLFRRTVPRLLPFG